MQDLGKFPQEINHIHSSPAQNQNLTPPLIPQFLSSPPHPIPGGKKHYFGKA